MYVVNYHPERKNKCVWELIDNTLVDKNFIKQFTIIQTNKCTKYIYEYFIYCKHSYMFRYTCITFRESYPLLEL